VNPRSSPITSLVYQPVIHRPQFEFVCQNANNQNQEPAEPNSLKLTAVLTTKARTSNKMLGSCSKMRYRTWTELTRNQAGKVELQRVIDIGQQVTSRRRVNNQNKHKLNSEAEKKTPQPATRRSGLTEEKSRRLAGLEHEEEPTYFAKTKNKPKLNTEVEKNKKNQCADVQKSLPTVSNIGMCLVPDELDHNVVARSVDLVCGKPHKPSRPAVVSKPKVNSITKPQQHVSHSTKAKAPPLQGPARPTNEERVFRDGGMHFRAANQRGEQTGQPARP
jgi:hypothetical protein